MHLNPTPPAGTGYDIIPDIHADMARLEATLRALGYVERQGAWRAPEGRRAAFLGDFIDTGRENLAVIRTVRAMIEAEEAVAIMGNHELNALHFHTPGENWLVDGSGYMRSHVDRNIRQHETFLAECPVGSHEAAEALAFFMTLPLGLDLGGLRLAHAAWSDTHRAAILARRPDARLSEDDLQGLALEDWDDPFVAAALSTLKGPEIPLPGHRTFTDHKGEARRNIRVSWWDTGAETWREVAASVPDASELPLGKVPADLLPPIDPGAHPVAFGHYKRRGAVVIDAPGALCLDYPDQPVAYRWDGETRFDPDRIVLIAA